MNQVEANQFNEYVGRISYMLDGIQNDCGTFVYYALEDVQAKFYPRHREIEARESDTDISTLAITRKIYEAGYDYSFADREEIVNAADLLKKGKKPTIFGSLVETIIIPAIDVMYADAKTALAELQKAGVQVLFLTSFLDIIRKGWLRSRNTISARRLSSRMISPQMVFSRL